MNNTLNVGIFANVDAGKTTLTEAICVEAGIKQVTGRVDKGTTIADNNQIEKEKGITITTTLLSFEKNGKLINILDTPGHYDFFPDVMRIISIIDVAILVIAVDSGVTPHTKRIIKSLRSNDVKIIIFINKCDRIDYLSMLSTIKNEIYKCDNQKDESKLVFIEGSALKNKNIATLFEMVVKEEVTRGQRVPDYFHGKVIKQEFDEMGACLTYIYIYEGKLQINDVLIKNKKKNKIKFLYLKVKDQLINAKAIDKGNIAIIKSYETHYSVGDEIKNYEVIGAKPTFIEGYRCKVKLKGCATKNQLYRALLEISIEEPNYQFEYDELLDEMSINLLGKTHEDVVRLHLFYKYGLDVAILENSNIKVRRIVDSKLLFVKVNQKGNKYAATMELKIEPQSNEDNLFISAVSKGYLRNSYQKAIEESIISFLSCGKNGYIYTHLKVTLTYAEYYSGVSTPGDYRRLAYEMIENLCETSKYYELSEYECFELLSVKNYSSILFNQVHLFKVEIVDLQNLTGDKIVIKGAVPKDFKRSFYLFLKDIMKDDFLYKKTKTKWLR
ncbi:GTP-binding protein [Vagococcus entomophilus]|uniref:Tr-type G domain-containing protein n=1 Tax=Vagococcus entomophilus TaxID=1160095 RepID=A0A430AEX4_9ENTE|nr:GTP-binding protein [Vagococcus entomophilus]RSU06149.1 hypothetical protein CBF30_10540 [Vagococcus entomophilus]